MGILASCKELVFALIGEDFYLFAKLKGKALGILEESVLEVIGEGLLALCEV